MSAFSRTLEDIANWGVKGTKIEDDEIKGQFDKYGNEFVIVCSGGIKAEGDPYPAWYLNPQTAIDRWYRAVARQLRAIAKKAGCDVEAEKHIRLIFRIRPELECMEVGEDPAPDRPHARKIPYYSVYSRLSFELGPTQEDLQQQALAQAVLDSQSHQQAA